MEGKNNAINRIGKLTLMGLGFSFLGSNALATYEAKTDANKHVAFIAGSANTTANTYYEGDGTTVALTAQAPGSLLAANNDTFTINPDATVKDMVTGTVIVKNGVNPTFDNNAGGAVFSIAPTAAAADKRTYNLEFASGNVFENAVSAQLKDGKITTGQNAAALVNFGFNQADPNITNTTNANATIKINPQYMAAGDTIVIRARGMLSDAANKVDNTKEFTVGKIEVDADKELNLLICNDTFDYGSATYDQTTGKLKDSAEAPTANTLILNELSDKDNNRTNLSLTFDRSQASSGLKADGKYDIEYAGDNLKVKRLYLGLNSEPVAADSPLKLNFSKAAAITINLGKGGIVAQKDAIVSFAHDTTVEFDDSDNAVQFGENATSLTFNPGNNTLTFTNSNTHKGVNPEFTVSNGKTLTFDGNVTFEATDESNKDYFPYINLDGGTLALGGTNDAAFKLDDLAQTDSNGANLIEVSNDTHSFITVASGKTGKISVSKTEGPSAIDIGKGATLTVEGKLTVEQDNAAANAANDSGLLVFGKGSTLEIKGQLVNGAGGVGTNNTTLTIGSGTKASTVGYYNGDATIKFTPVAGGNDLDIPQLDINNQVTFKELSDSQVTDGKVKTYINAGALISSVDIDNLKGQEAILIKASSDAQLKPILNGLGLTDDNTETPASAFIKGMNFVFDSTNHRLKIAVGNDVSVIKTVKEAYSDVDWDGMSDSFIEILDDGITNSSSPLQDYIIFEGNLNPNFEKISRAIGRTTTEEKNRATLQFISAARRSIYNHADIESSNRFNLWVSLFGSLGRQSKNGGYKMDSDVYGFLVGTDTYINESILLGLVGGYGKTDAEYKGDFLTNYALKNKPESYFGGLYGLWANLNNDMKLKFLAIFGRTKHKENSSVIDLENSTVVADTTQANKHHANWVSGNLDFTYKPFKFYGIHVGPWASLSFTHNKQKENNFIVGQNGTNELSKIIESAKVNAIEMTLGIAADYGFSTGSLEVKAGYKHDFRHDISGGKVTLKQGDNYKKEFDPYYDIVGKNTFALEAAYSAQFGNFGVSLGAQGEIGNQWKDFGGSLTASYSF